MKIVAEQPNVLKGSLYAIGAFFFMAVFGIVTKVALEESSFFWVSFISYLTGTLALLPYVVKKGSKYLQSNHYRFLLGRAIFGTLASFCYTISIQYIPIVNGTLLFNTAPVFIPLLVVLFLKERIPTSTWFAVVIGFIGIIIIIKPTAAIFTQSGNFIALFSGFTLAIAYLLMKLLTSTDPGVRIIFYYLGIGTLIQIPALFFLHDLPTIKSCYYAIAAGFLLLSAQLALVNGYKYASAPQIGIYQYLSVVFVGLFDFLIWGVVPNEMDIIGILLVIIAGIIIIRSGTNSKEAVQNPYISKR